MSAPITCPHCSTPMSPAARFCPGCGIPRTAVRQELERASVTTGTPYEQLLAQARAADARDPQPALPVAEPAPPAVPSNVSGTQVALIIGGVIAALTVAALISRFTADDTPASASTGTTSNSHIEQEIRDDLSTGFQGASWYGSLNSIDVNGSQVVANTSIYPDSEGKLIGQRLCLAISGSVYANENSNWDIEHIQIQGQDGSVIASRYGRDSLCETR